MFKGRRILLNGVIVALLLMLAALFVSERLGVNVPLRVWLPGSASPAEDVSHLQLPAGFRVSVFASGLQQPRMLRSTSSGALLVSLPQAGSVVLLKADSNADGLHDGRVTLLQGLNLPHGIDIHEGWLYVAETDAVGRILFDQSSDAVTGDYQRIITGLPAGKGHWTRTLGFGPDGMLYVSLGSSCNVCIETDPRRATMLRYQPDGSAEEVLATGLRNSVGFDWSPVDGALYATDNGRDWLGDDFPADELNRIVAGGFYGWPYANTSVEGEIIADPDYGEGQRSPGTASLAPSHSFRAHNAPLGMAFLKHSALPAKYRHAALVALHGSWNRSIKDGYKLVSLHWDEQGKIKQHDFMTGFLQGDRVNGRPVGVHEAIDGSIYISDDYAGVIYRVNYQP